MLQHMMARPVVANALRVSAVVGTILNVINQGSSIWTGVGIDWSRLALNYAVPFLVASYSAARVCQVMEG
ncbi:hypothetical protein NTCA1_51470 [Novosphingobium sp. TCA1]|nr:hypothetical protein NTCA1_51470 [Novosphingobium sp. TCA1]